MELNQAIELIKNKNISATDKTSWADAGCGSGLFTNALARLLMSGSKIYAIDKNADALRKLTLPTDVRLEKINADFIQDELNLQNLDGLLMANSLHFVRDKISLIAKMNNYLNPGGFFIIVEYDTDTPNPWVPFPVSYSSLQLLFEKAGYRSIHKIHEFPSRFNRANIYSAVITK